jgi:hypothetical protein
MKKVLLIAVVLFAVTTTKAQTQFADTLKTNSQWVKTKAVLPKDVTDVMTITRNKEAKTLDVVFGKHLTQDELELVKNYIRFYYDSYGKEWGSAKDEGYDSNAPDVYNEKKKCRLIFYQKY